MKTNPDLASLSHAELVALVQDLQNRLAERDQQIEQLKEQLEKQSTIRQLSPSPVEGLSPGSQEDLLAQLEKLYPGET
jgi:predicted RNase H-like nuclease (RuvC/YqgF family)